MNVGIIHADTEETREGLGSARIVVSLDKETGGFWKKEHADRKNAGPDELDGSRNTVGTVIVAVLGTFVGTRGEEESNRLRGRNKMAPGRAKMRLTMAH